MRRKIIPHGPSSMTISLPSSWVKQHHLKKGEELDVLEEDDNLTIKTVNTKPDGKKIDISFINLDSQTKQNLLLVLHRKGYDEIGISFDSQSDVKDLHAYLNSMQLGFEIIKQETNNLTIKNISNPEAEQLDSLFRRVFRITIEYVSKTDAILKGEEDITNCCLVHETSINRISNYCKRIIIQERKSNASFAYSMLTNLKNVANNISFIIALSQDLEPTDLKALSKKYTECAKLFSRSYELNYKFSLEEYSSIKNNLALLQRQLLATKAKDSRNSSGTNHLIDINNEITDLLDSILAMQF
ncbi:MAG: AbrB/MazE/SpoVT family DNA-binding domain-containing protein [Candidatus Nanoarchaeia archaeon]